MTAKARLVELGGEGPALLLIHGFGADSLSWAPLIAGLAANFSLWAVDLPGHGKAPDNVGDGSADTLAAAVRAATSDLDARHIVGHSLGGAIALKLAEQNRPAALTLLAPAGRGHNPDNGFLAGFAGAGSTQDLLPQLEKLVHRKALIQPIMAEHVLGQLQRPSRRAAFQKVATALASLPKLALPDCPYQVIWGADDVINPRPADMENLHVLPHCGHLPHVEAATKTARLIRDLHLA